MKLGAPELVILIRVSALTFPSSNRWPISTRTFTSSCIDNPCILLTSHYPSNISYSPPVCRALHRSQSPSIRPSPSRPPRRRPHQCVSRHRRNGRLTTPTSFAATQNFYQNQQPDLPVYVSHPRRFHFSSFNRQPARRRGTQRMSSAHGFDSGPAACVSHSRYPSCVVDVELVSSFIYVHRGRRKEYE